MEYVLLLNSFIKNMANFHQALDIVLKHECGDNLLYGAYTNNPNDPGGETYMGISRKYNKDWRGWDIIDKYKKSDCFPFNLLGIDDLNNLVSSCYKDKYWDAIKGDYIEIQPLANKFFDAIVQPGFISIKLMQRSILDLTKDKKFVADGIVGSKTLNYLNSLNCDELLDLFRKRLVIYYEEGNNNPRFINGWIKRAMS